MDHLKKLIKLIRRQRRLSRLPINTKITKIDDTEGKINDTEREINDAIGGINDDEGKINDDEGKINNAEGEDNDSEEELWSKFESYQYSDFEDIQPIRSSIVRANWEDKVYALKFFNNDKTLSKIIDEVMPP